MATQFSLKHSIIGWLGATLLRLLRWTQRWEHVNGPTVEWPGGRPYIVVFWHAQQLMMPWVMLDFAGRHFAYKMNVLISRHGDGRIIAAVMHALGIGSVAGSSSRGAVEASRELLLRIKAGDHISITPDGPRGPALLAKPGAIKIAAASGAPIIPLALGADRVWTFKSWDRMFLPKPFARVRVGWGTPILVPEDFNHEPIEVWTARLTAAINEATRVATTPRLQNEKAE